MSRTPCTAQPTASSKHRQDVAHFLHGPRSAFACFQRHVFALLGALQDSSIRLRRIYLVGEGARRGATILRRTMEACVFSVPHHVAASLVSLRAGSASKRPSVLADMANTIQSSFFGPPFDEAHNRHRLKLRWGQIGWAAILTAQRANALLVLGEREPHVQQAFILSCLLCISSSLRSRKEPAAAAAATRVARRTTAGLVAILRPASRLSSA